MSCRPLTISLLLALFVGSAGTVSAQGTPGPDLGRIASIALAQGDLETASDRYAEMLREDPDSLEALAGRGVTLLEQGRSREAVPFLERAHRLDPGHRLLRLSLVRAYLEAGRAPEGLARIEELPEKVRAEPDVRFLEGRARFELGDYRAAAELLSGEFPGPEPAESARLLRGVALVQLGARSQGVTLLEDLASRGSRSQVATQARDYLTRLGAAGTPGPGGPGAAPGRGGGERPSGARPGRGGSGPRRSSRSWRRVQLGLLYDSNVVVAPTTNLFGLRDQDLTSLGGNLGLDLGKSWQRGARDQLYLSYRGSQMAYQDTDSVNMQSHSLSLAPVHEGSWMGRTLRVGVSLGASHVFVDGSALVGTWSVSPFLQLVGGGGQSTILQGQLSRRDFLVQQGNEGTTEDRDGTILSLGLTHQFPLPRWKGWTARLGVDTVEERDQGDNLDYRGLQFRAGLNGSLPGSAWKLDLGVQVFERDYRRVHSFFAATRDDQEAIWSVNFFRRLSGDRSLQVGFQRDRNHSSLALYDYAKERTTLSMSWPF